MEWNMEMLVSCDDLYHHGIKGQRWGRRRFQNEDGSLTPAGKERYDDDNESNNAKSSLDFKRPELSETPKKSKHRMKLEEKYKAQGLNQEEAEQAASKRIKAEKYVAAAAVVTAASAIAYYKYREYSKDKSYSTDTEFQRIMSLAKDQPIQDGGRQYVAINKTDKLKYKGLYAQELSRKTDKTNTMYNVTVKNKQDVNVASRKNAENVFKNLYENDNDFKKILTDKAKSEIDTDKRLGIYTTDKIKEKIANDGKLTNKEYRKMYDEFNKQLTYNSAQNNKFYDALKAKGYNAVQDRNDQKFSGYNTKNPLILFDGKYDYTKNEMVKAQIDKDAAKGLGVMFGPKILAAGSAYVGMAIGSKKITDAQIKANNAKAVALYKEQHPNTKLTDKEIEEMLIAKS